MKLLVFHLPFTWISFNPTDLYFVLYNTTEIPHNWVPETQYLTLHFSKNEIIVNLKWKSILNWKTVTLYWDNDDE